MNIIKKLLGASAFAGTILLSATSLSADRVPDPGKNFTVSDSPETTVFNLQRPAENRHIHDTRKQAPAPAKAAAAPVVSGCDTGTVSDQINKSLVRLNKTAPAMVALNTPFSYEYTVEAKENAKKIVVEEQIPSGTEYVSSDPEAEVNGSTVIWTLYNVERGSTQELELVVKATQAVDFSNCATVVAYPEACTTTSVGVPELAIVKTTPNEQVLLNSDVPWEITVTNQGNFCAYDVVVSDALPEGVSHQSGNRQLVTELGTLSPGESRNITIHTSVNSTGQHCNQAIASSSNAGSAQAEACVEVVEPGLEVTKSGTPMQFVEKTASYEIVVLNTGDLPLTDVVVTDTVPAQNTLLSAPGAQISANTATWVTSLQPGDSETFNVTVEGLQAGTYCNQVSATSNAYGLSGSSDACTEWRGYPALLIEVIDTNDPLLVGEETTYVIQITNQGTAADTNVKLDVELPAGLEVVSAAGDTRGSIIGNKVAFEPYAVLSAKEIIEFRVVAKAVAEGDSRFKAQMNSDLLKTPVPEEEATQVY